MNEMTRNPPFPFPSPLPHHPIIERPMPNHDPFDLGDEDDGE
jgi:hypothetical protein